MNSEREHVFMNTRTVFTANPENNCRSRTGRDGGYGLSNSAPRGHGKHVPRGLSGGGSASPDLPKAVLILGHHLFGFRPLSFWIPAFIFLDIGFYAFG